MARVLILEDEPVLRSSMARGIAKVPGVTVVEAASVRAALESIDAEPPQMIVSDIDLPDRSGVELLGELGRRRLRVPVLFVSAYLKAYGSQIPPHADVDVREKPIELEELRSIVRSRISAPKSDEEAPFGPTDYIQLACLGHRSVLIDVDAGTLKGTIAVSHGELWSATDLHGEGEEAFRRLAFLPGASVRVRALREDRPPRTIHAGWEGLLLDAARELDEVDREGGESAFADDIFADFGGPASEPEPTPEPVFESAFDTAFEAGVMALLSKDYAEAYAAFLRASEARPEDPKTQTNLARLRELGHGSAAREPV